MVLQIDLEYPQELNAINIHAPMELQNHRGAHKKGDIKLPQEENITIPIPIELQTSMECPQR